ncbi:MAG: hypothetical protein H0X29_08855 [Parachlamydiaceae bacterium]|nr:hypothetical protein [Parachlamydiaceae bacterium]
MFKKRIKKEYPPGTFIPMAARVCAIIQLCLAFALILWNISQPFMGELFTYKSQMLIYQDVMGIHNPADSVEKLARKERNSQRLEALAIREKIQLTKYYEELLQLSQRTFIQKATRSIHILVFEIPFYEQLWLLLSCVLPILLLKKIEGATQAIWLLPLLTCIYACDNQRYGLQKTLSAEARLFPTEQVLMNDYLKQPLSLVLMEQKEQLLSAWNLYLAREWSPLFSMRNSMTDPAVNTLSNSVVNGADFDELVEQGEFAFNIARINSLPHPKEILKGKTRYNQEGLMILAIYLFWNFFFAANAFNVLKNDQKDKNNCEIKPFI